MAKGENVTLYTPEGIDTEDPREMLRWTKREFEKIKLALDAALARQIEFLNVEPAKPREGMIRGADGTNWNPGLGKGVYVFMSGVWVRSIPGTSDKIVITATRTFNKSEIPFWVQSVFAYVWGGGGGGGGGNNAIPSRGTGGGGGGFSRLKILVSALPASLTATVGAGGVGGVVGNPGSDGTAGGNSSFGSFNSATGGAPGLKATGIGISGSSGGVGTGGDINEAGTYSTVSDGGVGTGAVSLGGDAPFRPGGGRANVSANAVNVAVVVTTL
jgi:hypothetical protein